MAIRTTRSNQIERPMESALWAPRWSERVVSAGLALASMGLPRLGRAARRPLPLLEDAPVSRPAVQSAVTLEPVAAPRFGRPRLHSA